METTGNIEYVLHEAALKGSLHMYHGGNLTLRKLVEKDKIGRNVFHCAVAHGHLNQIPKEFLTEENLLSSAGNLFLKWNCFHFAAANSNLHTIPKKFLTPQNLLKVVNSTGLGPFLSPLEIYLKSNEIIEFTPKDWVHDLRKLILLNETCDNESLTFKKKKMLFLKKFIDEVNVQKDYGRYQV